MWHSKVTVAHASAPTSLQSGVTLVCTAFKSEMEQLTSKTKCVCTYVAPFWASRYLEQYAPEWGVLGVMLVCACASRDLSLFRLLLFRLLLFRLLSFRLFNIFTSIGESSIIINMLIPDSAWNGVRQWGYRNGTDLVSLFCVIPALVADRDVFCLFCPHLMQSRFAVMLWVLYWPTDDGCKGKRETTSTLALYRYGWAAGCARSCVYLYKLFPLQTESWCMQWFVRKPP